MKCYNCQRKHFRAITKDTRANKLISALILFPKILGRLVVIREPWVNIYLVARKSK